MKLNFILVFTVLILNFLAGCNNEKPEQVDESNVTVSYSTKKAALDDFLKENPRSEDVELIITTDGDEILLVRYGNQQYSSYGIDNNDGTYSIVKLEAWTSLHNTFGVSSEITTPSGNEITYSIIKEGQSKNMSPSDKTDYEYVSIFSESIKFALNKGHILNKRNSAVINVIDSTEEVASGSSS